MNRKFDEFAKLHVAGEPLVLFNIWDTGSARAVVAAGAKAIATGSHPVGDASGFGDGEQVPLEFVLGNATRIVAAVEQPVTIDFEGGYATDPCDVARNVELLKRSGAVGCNFEDQIVGREGLHPLNFQARRIAAIRNAVGEDFFINARTDLFLKTREHDDSLVDQVVERGRAFAEAGANGFFVPLLSDPAHIARVVSNVPLPLNVLAYPGAPAKRLWAQAGVARISHGPFPHRALMATLTQMAAQAID